MELAVWDSSGVDLSEHSHAMLGGLFVDVPDGTE